MRMGPKTNEKCLYKKQKKEKRHKHSEGDHAKWSCQPQFCWQKPRKIVSH